jgi:hypothetical protein
MITSGLKGPRNSKIVPFAESKIPAGRDQLNLGKALFNQGDALVGRTIVDVR